MTEAGLAKVREAKKNGEWQKARLREVSERIPSDLKTALAANKAAMQNFENFTASYQKQYIWWITNAKRDETRKRRIEETVRRAEENKKPGMN